MNPVTIFASERFLRGVGTAITVMFHITLNICVNEYFWTEILTKLQESIRDEGRWGRR